MPSVGKTCVLVRTIIRQGRAKPQRGNDDGQPTGPQMENCKRFPAQRVSGAICVAFAPTRGQTTREPHGWPPVRPRWRKTAAVRNTFKGLRSGNSSWRLVLVPSNSLEQSNGALAWANPQETKPRSCIVLGLKPMGKLITRDKYLSIRQNQGIAWSSDSNL